MHRPFYKKDGVYKVYTYDENTKPIKVKVAKVHRWNGGKEGFYYFYDLANPKTDKVFAGMSEEYMTVNMRGPLALAIYHASFSDAKMRRQFVKALTTPDRVS